MYGTSNLDIGKTIVLLSCGFNIFMTYWIATDPMCVISSPQGGGWWDPLLRISHDDETDIVVALYPRIWATFLLFQLVVRLNWVFTEETTPALYHCVLLSYVLPFGQYLLECIYFKTLPPFDGKIAMVMMGPWIAILVGYRKYTAEGGEDGARKRSD